MQVSVESTGNLSRRMTVELPAERVDQEVARRLAQMGRTVRLKGFRPGKAPEKIVKQQFGSRVAQEVLGDFIRTSYQEAVNKESLRPAGGPSIRPEVMGEGLGLKYVAEFEVLPEVELADFGGIEISRPVAEVKDSDVDKMLESLRKQRAKWEPVARASQSGDRLVIDYEGTVGGEPFANNVAQDFNLELGARRWLPSFEDQLIGSEAGQQRAIDVDYPENTQPVELAGRTVHFDVRIKSVLAASLPELDDAFAMQFGVTQGGITALKHEVRANMERELRQRTATVLRDRVMNVLLEKHNVELPQVMVTQEVERLRWSTQQGGGEKLLSTIPQERIEAEAKRRATLGLIVGEIVRNNKIRLDAAKLRQNIDLFAASYEDPKKVADYYYANADARASVEALTLEQQVVEWVLAKAKVTDQTSSFDELVNSKAV